MNPAPRKTSVRICRDRAIALVAFMSSSVRGDGRTPVQAPCRRRARRAGKSRDAACRWRWEANTPDGAVPGPGSRGTRRWGASPLPRAATGDQDVRERSASPHWECFDGEASALEDRGDGRGRTEVEAGGAGGADGGEQGVLGLRDPRA